MPESSPRRFTLADLMIGVAIVACDAAFLRWWIPGSFGYPISTPILGAAGIVLGFLGPVVLFWRMRSPRPTRREWGQQPGTAAAIALTVMPLTVLALSYASWRWAADLGFASPGGQRILFLIVRAAFAPEAMGSAVTAVWLSLRLVGPWAAPTDWVEQAGRLLGWATLVAALAVNVHWIVPREWTLSRLAG